MGRGLRCLVAIGLSLAGLAAFGPGAALAGTLDQQQTDSGGVGLAIGNDVQSVAQTFTAGISGKLDRVDLNLSKSGSPGALTVEIRTLSGSDPGTTVLASASVPASAVGGSPANIPVTFGVPTTVAAGTQYAIVALNSTTGVPDVYGWQSSVAPNPYTAGAGFTAVAPASTSWTLLAAADLAFATYVTPPLAGPTGQRAAALKKCAKIKKNKKKKKKCKKRARKLPV
jgi:hypothetical protein